MHPIGDVPRHERLATDVYDGAILVVEQRSGARMTRSHCSNNLSVVASGTRRGTSIYDLLRDKLIAA